MKWNFSLIAKQVLPKKNVMKIDGGILFSINNILPKITIRDFKISKFLEQARILLNNHELEMEDMQQIYFLLGERQISLLELEQIPEITITKKDHPAVVVPGDFQRNQPLRIVIAVDMTPPIKIDFTRIIQ